MLNSFVMGVVIVGIVTDDVDDDDGGREKDDGRNKHLWCA